jgi:hypothetical protein
MQRPPRRLPPVFAPPIRARRLRSGGIPAGSFRAPSRRALPWSLGALLFCALHFSPCSPAGAAENAGSANLFFDFRTGTQSRPPWCVSVQHDGGAVDGGHGWFVASNAPPASGKIVVALDRGGITDNLAMGLVLEDAQDSDLAVQLWDDQNRIVAVDLFFNLLFKTRQAKTDTFIIPLKRYPHATKVVIRRVSGPVSIYALAMYPVAADMSADVDSQEQLAKFFGDPLSPTNSLRDALALTQERREASAKLALTPALPPAGTNNPGWILGPLDGDRVPRVFDMRGRTPPLAAGHHLWIFVQVGRFQFPKGEVTADGQNWQTKIKEDGSPPGGRFFIVLYDADADAHARFTEHKRKAKATGHSPAITDLPGTTRLARVALRLQPD